MEFYNIYQTHFSSEILLKLEIARYFHPFSALWPAQRLWKTWERDGTRRIDHLVEHPVFAPFDLGVPKPWSCWWKLCQPFRGKRERRADKQYFAHDRNRPPWNAQWKRSPPSGRGRQQYFDVNRLGAMFCLKFGLFFI